MSGTPITAELIAIGSELLLGDGVDTNSAWISGRLRELGISVRRHTTVSDRIGDMVAALQHAIERSDLVIATGGLGPTQDDLTRVAVAQVAGVALQRDDAMAADIASYFAARGVEMPDSNLQQADLPVGGRWLSRVGSAPGFVVEIGPTLVACMPGVPSEMRQMMDGDVLRILRDRGAAAITVSRVVRTSGRSESGIASSLADLAEEVEATDDIDLAFLASRGETRVKVTATAGDRDAALARIEPFVQQVVALLGDGVVGLDGEGVEHAIGRVLIAAGQTMAVAESITGGGVGARLVTVPGASTWFRGGLITYAAEAKHLLAGLQGAVLQGDGPVSEAAARGLAAAAVDRLGADVGLGVVGVAGPDPVGKVTAGTVWMAVARPAASMVARRVRMPGRGRTDVLDFAASAALAFLHDQLRGA